MAVTKYIWSRAGDWLKQAPIEGPVDRRNAPFMQVLLICVALFVAMNKAVLWSFSRDPGSSELIVDALTDMMIVAAASISLFHIRRGNFRHGVKLYLVITLAAGMLAYAFIGLKRLSADPFPLLLLGLAGLMLGRRSLWTVYAVLMVTFALGAASDAIHQLQHGDGQWQWKFRPILGMTYLVVAVVLDRTIAVLRDTLAVSDARGLELERANERLRQEMADGERTMEHLVHAQKMEAVGRIASGVAHDFDNILGVILGYTARRERLADGGIKPLMDAMDGIQTAAERAALISRQLLGFSRHDRRTVVTMDLLEVMREVTPMMRQLFGAQTQVTVRMPEQPVWVEMDHGQLELILLSIAANANDAMPAGGRFDVSTSIQTDHVVVALCDSGTGIAAVDAARIFEPFYTTKPIGSGTGLGLSVARDVLTRAGGDISVRSRRGQGSTFTMRLPLAAQTEVPRQRVTSPANR